MSDGYWVTNTQAPFAPMLVTNSGNVCDKGQIHASQPGQGMGDCMSNDKWTWDHDNGHV
jgi:hypothetical protein